MDGATIGSDCWALNKTYSFQEDDYYGESESNTLWTPCQLMDKQFTKASNNKKGDAFTLTLKNRYTGEAISYPVSKGDNPVELQSIQLRNSKSLEDSFDGCLANSDFFFCN